VARAGERIGLLGGSFDPAHAGHLRLTREALRRLRLARVWWLVSPGNPLKPNPPAAMALRIAAARRLAGHPRIVVTDLEARLGTRFTADTLAALARAYPGVRFVWLMGADNLAGLHRWDRWRDIAAQTPMAVFARPGTGLAALAAPAARAMARARRPAHAAPGLAAAPAPAWTYLTMPLSPLSSSALRARGLWPARNVPAAPAQA
jgi:nicotinate-nucleotide adenylyltransferase